MMQPRSPLAAIQQFHQELMAVRRDLHANPEMGFQEVRTSGIVAGALAALGIEVHRGIGKTGVVGVIKGQRTDSGKMIGLRADMDALPIHEENATQYCSTVPGMMHACGHDGHTTILLGTAKYLMQNRNFNGTAILIFQPAEEGLGGAKAMVEDGLFERFPCDAIYALHNWPALPAGVVGINAGPMMAASDKFEITIQGRGGHGAHPYQTIDPIVVAANMVTALQTIVSRNVHPLEAAVLSFGHIHAGAASAPSVIPGQAKLVGTVRTFSDEVQKVVETRMRTLIESIAQGYGASAEFNYVRNYPATINTASCADFVAEVATDLFGADRVVCHLMPSMGSEDFSFMLKKVPGAYFRLGQGGAEDGRFLHNPRFDFNDDVIPVGSATFAALVERSMPL
jgi:hippurate hydrolase